MNGRPYYLTTGAFNLVMEIFFYIQVDYDSLSIWHRYCLSIEHLVRNYNITYNKKKSMTIRLHLQAT